MGFFSVEVIVQGSFFMSPCVPQTREPLGKHAAGESSKWVDVLYLACKEEILCFITLAVGSMKKVFALASQLAVWWCRLQAEDGGTLHCWSSSLQPISRAPKLVLCCICQLWSHGENRCYICLQSAVCKCLFRNNSGRVLDCKSGPRHFS